MLGLEEVARDEIEVAALLHDVGKIGVPDYVLMKPGKLTAEELIAMERHRRLSVEILSACSASQNVLDVVANTGAWYNGCREGFRVKGDNLPLGARMVSIVDAFDAMTTDHVYRRRLSRERAIAELFEYAGTQFDPHLVRKFCSFISSDQTRLQEIAIRRWLADLRPEAGRSFWKLSQAEVQAQQETSRENFFHEQLLDSMTDAVVFIDPNLQILCWNRAAERLTGIASEAVMQQVVVPIAGEPAERAGRGHFERRLSRDQNHPRLRAGGPAVRDSRPQWRERASGYGRHARVGKASARRWGRQCCCTMPRTRSTWNNA